MMRIALMIGLGVVSLTVAGPAMAADGAHHKRAHAHSTHKHKPRKHRRADEVNGGPVTPNDGGDGQPRSSEPPVAPPVAAGHVVSYQQSAGFGGVLVLERANGERVTAYFGEKTDLECTGSVDGAFAPCTKDNLKPWTGVAFAQHGVNSSGSDVWTKIWLVGTGSGEPPTNPGGGSGEGTTPPPAPSSVSGTIASYEQGAGFGGTLVIRRDNGETVRSFFGEKTDLECAPSADAARVPCTKPQLVAGAVVADAAHAVNQYGYDVWTHVYLIVPGFGG